MAESPVKSSDGNLLPSSTKSQLQRKLNKWEKTKNLVEWRLEALRPKENNSWRKSISVSTGKSDAQRLSLSGNCCPPSMENAEGVVGSGDGVLISATERALQIQANLPNKFPSFVKGMSKSHVSGGFWLGLPKNFCVNHLPKDDATIILLGESKDYSTVYLAEKSGLSGGWRGFAIAHKLVEGDALVFQLIKSCTIKVHIVRSTTSKRENAGRSLLNLHAEPIETAVKMVEDLPEEMPPVAKKVRKKYQEEPVELNRNRNKNFRKSMLTIEPAFDHSCNTTGNFDTVAIKLSVSPLDFKNVESFDDFKIEYDGLILDSKIPDHLRKKYYELCLSQKSFLHQNLTKYLNIKLVCGLVNEMVNIADAIQAARPSPPHDHLKSWDVTLKAFGEMGMMVDFLRARIVKLLNISTESRAGIEMKRNELKRAKNELSDLRKRILDGERLIEKLYREIDYLVADRDDELEVVFIKIAGAPW